MASASIQRPTVRSGLRGSGAASGTQKKAGVRSRPVWRSLFIHRTPAFQAGVPRRPEPSLLYRTGCLGWWSCSFLLFLWVVVLVFVFLIRVDVHVAPCSVVENLCHCVALAGPQDGQSTAPQSHGMVFSYSVVTACSGVSDCVDWAGVQRSACLSINESAAMYSAAWSLSPWMACTFSTKRSLLPKKQPARIRIPPSVMNAWRYAQREPIGPICNIGRFPISFSFPSRLAPSRLALARLAQSRLALARLAPSRLALARLALARLAQSRLAPSRLAPSRLAPSRLALARLALARLAQSRLAPSRLAPSRLPPSRLALARLALARLAKSRLAPSRLALARLAPSRLALARLALARLALAFTAASSVMAMLLCSASWTNNTEPLKRHLISIFMNSPEKKMPPKIARLSAALRPGAQRPTNGEEERNWVIGAPTGNRTLLQTHRQVRRNPVRGLEMVPAYALPATASEHIRFRGL